MLCPTLRPISGLDSGILRNGLRRVKKSRGRRTARRLMLESLEQRRVLAAINWDGGGDGSSWANAANWSGDARPGSGDDVTIDVQYSESHIDISGLDVAILSLQSSATLTIMSDSVLSIAAESQANAAFNNHGRVQVLRGYLGLWSGGVSSGMFSVAEGATLYMSGYYEVNSLTVEETPRIFGAGDVQLWGVGTIAGKYAVTGHTTLSGLITFTGDISSPMQTLTVCGAWDTLADLGPNSLEVQYLNLQDHATLRMKGNLTVTQEMHWVTGRLEGEGATTIASTATLVMNSPWYGDNNRYLNGRILNNEGSATWSAHVDESGSYVGGGWFYLEAGAVINNLPGATFEVQREWHDSQAFTCQNMVGSAFHNEGSFIVSGPTSTVAFSGVPFNNNGSVQVRAGYLGLWSGGVSSGTFNVAEGATLNMSGYYEVNSLTVEETPRIFGAGHVQLWGVGTIAGKYAVTGHTTLSGLITFTGDISPPMQTLTVCGAWDTLADLGPNSLEVQYLNLQDHATLRMKGNLTVTREMHWVTGRLEGEGATTIASTATLVMNSPWYGDNNRYLNGRILNNEGSATWSAHVDEFGFYVGGGWFYLEAGAVINNLPGATFEVQREWHDSKAFICQDMEGSAFHNEGSFIVSGPTSTVAFSGVPFNNNGSVQVRAGYLGLYTGYTQHRGETILSGGSISCWTPLDIQGGRLSGSGTINGGVTNGGQVSPGISDVGAIEINSGNYTQADTGVLEIEISRSFTGTEFDQLTVDGDVSLAGTLSVSVAGFSLDVGEQFVIIDNVDSDGGTTTGDFADLFEGNTLCVGTTRFSITYTGGDDGKDVVLTVVEVQDDDVFLYGTSGDDTIVIGPVGNTGAVEWTLNGVSQGSFLPEGRIVVFAGEGNDDVQVAGSIEYTAWLDGGPGNDRLKGGAGHDLLLGEEGDDLLVGGSGRDLLIGGLGADRIVGNADDDILISGYTDYDSRADALQAIMLEWTSERSYGERCSNIEAGIAGAAVYLKSEVTSELPRTVHDDNAADVLTGSQGVDWFFANLFLSDDAANRKDKITDLHASEFAADLDWILTP